ncbi:MAG: aminotransferase class I/II-fold pyridoxal phosphate-dependent enzyme [Thermoguttaceae bacterium]|nr:aminotransferase class I/II-fold pyridoxal phosphate-dependent enzyme [Thermoguttaceae bacterium]MBQ1865142.1 aminotransferase class I/II-fold pyridoxal phosphate-dependent enzyme [Thermoguttaceae bacterium]MBQ2556916.1 aminotransferase class I/II-fold pyridoxal phosphate-dependent enzyme [Thermoguttaceae bacterium]MBQ3823222.1 aminotransferase class I/II-fold pyridoxal phosphate-dependent enzyme [Thermoguttaceae bacterium]MBQ4081253.1 aminotransferase class I/II-fold pyridoxal phosphate-dep
MSQFEEQKQEDERIESTENLVNVSLEAVAANRESLEATDDAPDDARPFEINVADRIKKLPPYLFAELNALKYAKRREGADVVDLGMGSPTDPPAQSVIDKLAEAVKNPKVHRYGASRGIKNLRAEMAARYLKYYGVRLNPDTEVMATLGSKDALSHTILALCGPGDLAIVPSPYFPAHLYAVMLAGGETLAIDVRNPERLLSEVAYACERFLPRPKLMIVNFPHNPTATVVDQEFYVDLVRLAKKYGFMVLSDLAYADIVFDGYVTPSFLAVPGAKDVGVEMTTMSKSYSMAGWRIGYCCGNSEIVRALATIKTYYDYGAFMPLQIAGIVALREQDAYVSHMAKVYEHRRNVLCDALERIGWEVERPKASMFVWQKIPEKYLKGSTTFDFAMKLLAEANVVVSPGSAFGPLGEGYLRLAVVEKEERLRQAVRQIAHALD